MSEPIGDATWIAAVDVPNEFTVRQRDRLGVARTVSRTLMPL